MSPAWKGRGETDAREIEVVVARPGCRRSGWRARDWSFRSLHPDGLYHGSAHARLQPITRESDETQHGPYPHHPRRQPAATRRPARDARPRRRGEDYDHRAFESRLGSAVQETVNEQIEAGLDVVNDGEMAKMSWSGYIRDRLGGYE